MLYGDGTHGNRIIQRLSPVLTGFRTQAGVVSPRHDHLQKKYERVLHILSDMGSAIVAFSGGVDSTLLLKIAKDALENGVIAVTVDSETTSGGELQEAQALARRIGVELRALSLTDLDEPEFTKNSPERCYVCKRKRFGKLREMADQLDIAFILDGENAEDENDHRPGRRAAYEQNVKSPLKEANLNKTEIRALSRYLGLPTWNKPSLACLASRIPYGNVITKQKLRQVDEAEQFLRTLVPTSQVRVRHHGDVARIEVAQHAMARLMKNAHRQIIIDQFKRLGFSHVAVDLEGYTTGSLNRGIGTRN